MKQLINISAINTIKSELDRRKNILIRLAYNSAIFIDKLDRECIKSFFERGEIPARPKTISDLMQTFFICCFTYAPLRKYLTSVTGSIPTPDMLPHCLSIIYEESSFINKENWYPEKLYEIAGKIQKTQNYDLKSNKFKPRMIAVLLTGSKEMSDRLNNGIEDFYSELSEISSQSAETMWDFVKNFPINIYNVGTALICNFFKDIGFVRFIKVDHHFKREFPNLIGFDDCKKLSMKEHFIISQKIADSLQITPFHLDHLLYQWGRYKKYESSL